MSDRPSPGRAALTAGLLALLAIACSSDVVDLLPAMPSAGNAGTATSSTAGVSSGGTRDEGGSNALGQAGVSGALATSGNGGTASGGCSGFGCGDAGENPGVGGSFGGQLCGNGMSSCTPCLSDVQCLPEQFCSRFLGNICVQCAENGKGQCKLGYTCDRLVGRCGPSCKSTMECNDGRVCDMAQGTCVTCIDNQQCESDGDPDTRVCYLRRCVQCLADTDCTQGGRRRCAGLQCVECVTDKDCPPSNGSDSGHCDTAHAHCQ